MVYIIISVIIILCLLLGYATWRRRVIYKEIDRLESWKIDVMNRPVTEEIARVKKLKMIGETEQKFENWRQDWDDIITIELPSIEEKLFEAEEYADKYRFKHAVQINKDIKVILDSCEERITVMLKDLNEIVNSEEQNSKDITPVRDAYHNVKKQLITNRSQYHNSIIVLESQFEEIEKILKLYEKETNDGNYITARNLLLSVKEQLDAITFQMEEIPALYKELENKIPQQIKEIEDGLIEMKEKGYILDHLNVDQHIREMRKHLQLYLQAIEKCDIVQVQDGVKDINERIDYLYQQFENEVESKKQVTQENPVLRHDISLIGSQLEDIRKETEIIKQSYKVDKEDIEQQNDLNKAFTKLENDYQEVDTVIKDKKQAYSILFEKMEDMRVHLNALREGSVAFKSKIQALRKDELAAKETIQSLRKKLFASRRMIEKSNLPGIPDQHLTIFEEAQEILSEINLRLDKKPLEMHSINQLLQEALKKVTFCVDKTKELVDAAVLSEKMIQYGNRYRSQNPSIANELDKAESYFRSYNYEEALEIVAFAINQVEPGALKKFDVSLKDIS